MLITRTSQLSGRVRSREINVTKEQLQEWLKSRKHIDVVLSHLSNSEREFLLTGITDDEWDQLMADAEGQTLEQFRSSH